VPTVTDAIDWESVERFANVGAAEDEIVAGLGITEAQLKDPVSQDRLRRLVTLGNAKKDLLLREQIDALGKGVKTGGSHTVALEARNRLGWDKQQQIQDAPPDLGSAHARLTLTLTRLAEARSAIEGRVVTPAELLVREIVPEVAH
jgi:hypothetical protein